MDLATHDLDLTAWLAQENLALYCQADGMPRSLMLERFRNDPRSVSDFASHPSK